MEIRVLGSPELATETGVAPLADLAGLVLGLLALATAPVPLAELVALLGDPGAPSSRRVLEVHLRTLGDLLPDGALFVAAEDVSLRTHGVEFDARAFEDDVAAGRAAFGAGDVAAGTALLRHALGRWRGEVLGDLVVPAWAEARVVGLNADRAAAERMLDDAARSRDRAGGEVLHRPVDLPRGVITFLFTDIVGSTPLWDRDPTLADAAVIRHDEILAEVVDDAGGVMLRHRAEGDSTFSVFFRPTDAMAAAVEGQRRLDREPWADGAPIAVRMGIHTGEAIERGGDYYGPQVNRAARVRGLAGAGEILLSSATERLVRASVPPSVRLVSRGTVELRGLAEPELIFDVVDDERPLPIYVTGPGSSEAGSVGAAVDASASRFTDVVADLPAWPFPFAGRIEEAAVVRQLAVDARAGTLAAVTLVGEPGIGKTRLAVECARAAVGDGAVVLFGRCDHEVALPYQPVAQALGALVAGLPLVTLDAWGREFGVHLARLLPGVRRRLPWLPPDPPGDPERNRHLLFDAVRGLLDLVLAVRPIVLIVDDLQWADRQTLQLLRYLSGALAARPLLVVFTCRAGEAPRGDEGPASLFAHLRRHHTYREISLTGLDGATLRPVAFALAGDDAAESEALADRAALESDGNPLFFVELVRHAMETGGFAGDRADGLPAGVRDVCLQRVQRLGPRATEVLATAAVAGLDFGLDEVTVALDADLDEVLDVFADSMDVHLLAEGAEAGRFRFTHALIAAALVDNLGPLRAARRHIQLATALSALHPDPVGAHSPAVAAHLVAAGTLADRRAVRACARAAGDHALAMLAPDEAQRWYETALALLPPGDADGTRRGLLLALGTAQHQAGVASFRETLLEAARLAAAAGDDDGLVAAALANNRGDRSRAHFVDAERIAVLRQAAAVSADVAPRAAASHARLLARLASELSHDPDWRRRLAISDEALSIARASGDRATIADVLRLRFEATRMPDTLQSRRAEAAELVQLAEALDDAGLKVSGHMTSARAALESGDVVSMDAHFAAAWSLRDEVRLPFVLWNTTSHVVERHTIRGDLAAAEQCAVELFSLGKQLGEPDAGAVLTHQMMLIRSAQGRIGEEIPRIAAAWERYPHLVALRVTLAFAFAETGDLDRARELIDIDVDEEFAAHHRDLHWVVTMALAARVASMCDHPEAARLLMPLLSPFPTQLTYSGAGSTGPIAADLGRLCIVLGDYPAALAHLDIALDIARGMGAPLWIAEIRLAEAAARRARGFDEDDVLAVAAVRESAEIAERHGFGRITASIASFTQGSRRV